MLMYGKPKRNSAGALETDTSVKGFIPLMQELNGEHDRFLTWIAGRRARELKAEGRENLLDDDDINWAINLGTGNLPDGTARAALYARVHAQFQELNKSVNDIAERAGLISAADRASWEKYFYVPFYRLLEDGKYGGPRDIKGLVNQEAFKRLTGGKEVLNDIMGNVMRNWAHMLCAAGPERYRRGPLSCGRGAPEQAEGD